MLSVAPFRFSLCLVSYSQVSPSSFYSLLIPSWFFHHCAISRPYPPPIIGHYIILLICVHTTEIWSQVHNVQIGTMELLNKH